MSEPLSDPGSKDPPAALGVPPRSFVSRLFRPSFLFKFGLTALLLWLVFRSIDFGRLRALLVAADLVLIAGAVLFTVLVNALKPIRWLWLLGALVPQATYGVALRSILFGAGARLVLPGKVGELGRVLAVPGLRLVPGVGLTLLDLLLETAAAFLVAIPGALVFAGPKLAAVFVLLSALCLGAIFFPHRVLFPLFRLPYLRRRQDRVEAIGEVMHRIGTPKLLFGVGLSIFLNLIRFGQLYLLFVALGFVPGVAAVLVFPLVQLADGFPFTVGGVGVREWLSLQLLPRVGILPEAAVAAVFLQFLITNILPGLAGGYVIYRGRGVAGQKLRDALASLRKAPPKDP